MKTARSVGRRSLWDVVVHVTAYRYFGLVRANRLSLVCCAFAIALWPAHAAPPHVEKMNMFVGEAKVLDNLNVKRIVVGNANLMRVRILNGGQLLIIAEKEGSTSLHLWHADGSESDMNVRIAKDDHEVRVRLEKMIYMDVKIVEFRKSALKTLGVDWKKSIDGPVFGTAGDALSNGLFRGSTTNDTFRSLPKAVKPFQTYFGIATEITSTINYLASTGDAYALAEPRLSSLNGTEAKFLAGGQLPIPIRNANGEITVEFKDFGIILDILPLADDSGVIATKIKTEVSSVDPSLTVLGVPGFLTRRTETQLNVREGETIVISGLVNSEMTEDINKIPGLGDIPVLGHLFKSTNFKDQKTELVIFVTPRIFSPETNAAEIARTKERTEKRAKELEQRLRFGLAE